MLSNVETGYKLRYGPDAQDLQGKTIIVVGGAANTARLTAAMLASEGARLYIAAATEADLQAALSEVRQIGGEADGQVVDFSSRSAIGRFFDAAENRFGHIHALVNYYALDETPLDDPAAVEECQNACLQESILHMQGEKYCQVVNIGQGKSGQTGRSITAALRRQAKELGIRVTLIEPGETFPVAYQSEAIAQCVLDSLVQPYGVDIIFMQQMEGQPN